MYDANLSEINEIYYDVLKEIGNVGAGNATTAVANMLNMRIDMRVPNVKLLTLQSVSTAVSGEEDEIVGVYLGMEKDISGSMMFVLKMDSAHYLVNKLMGNPTDWKEPFTEMEQSALKEIGNIIAGAYLSALSSLTHMVIAPTVPYIAIDMAASILSVAAIQFGQYGDYALMIETEFGDDKTIEGYFILLPEPESYSRILKSLGIPQ